MKKTLPNASAVQNYHNAFTQESHFPTPRAAGLRALDKRRRIRYYENKNRILTRVWYGTDMKLIERIFGNFKSVSLLAAPAAFVLTLVCLAAKARRGNFKSRFKTQPFFIIISSIKQARAGRTGLPTLAHQRV